MSLLDTASLIVTPNGYKEGKLYSVIPSDGSGDLSVTRATTATRVNSQGLVELVPYNLFTYSEQFDNADWSKSSGTITANATTAPNGTTTADLYTANGALSNHDFFEGFTGGSQTTASIYVKKNTAQYVYISLNYQSSGVNWATGIYDLDALTTATFQSGGVTSQVATISDEGNGWRRITLKVDTANTDLYCMYGVADSMSPTLGSRGRVENSSSASFYAWGSQVVEGSVAKDYQKTETRLNIPRLDYSNGTCPSILVEPQRTNVCVSSNNLSGWINQTGNTTLTRIQSGGVDGGAFDRLVTTGSGNQGRYVQFTALVGSYATFSVYLRGTGTVELGIYNAGQSALTSITLTSEWTRYEAKITTGIVGYIDWSIFVFGGNTTDVCCAQMEFASYATSYIPTTSASVTRNADVISKTGISSLIGQTEGTIFLDFYYDGSTNNHMIIRDSGYATYIYFNSQNANELWGQIQTANIQFSMSATAGRYKMALAYKSGSSALYVNGTQIGTSATTFSVAGTISELDYTLTTPNNKINASALWKTRLTNTQLAQLTTI